MDRIKYFILLCVLLVIAWLDGKKQIVPNKLLAGFIYCRLLLIIGECALNPYQKNEIIFSLIVGSVLGGIPFALCYLFFKNGIGGGDVKLMFITGMYVGPTIIFEVMFFSFTYCGCYVLWCFLKEKKYFRKKMPFAPFLFAGTMTTLYLKF